MKPFLTCLFFASLAFSLSARTIKLHYEPHGKIIKFCFRGITVYTDSSSLFYMYDHDPDRSVDKPYLPANRFKVFDDRVRNLLRRNCSISGSDTASFSDGLVPFNDGIGDYCVDTEYDDLKYWYTDGPMLELTKAGRVKIIDSHGNHVKVVDTKRYGSRRQNHIWLAYRNKATKEELLFETLFIRLINPRF
jgi:hypothetical protein